MKYDGWGEKVREEVTPCCHLTRLNPEFFLFSVLLTTPFYYVYFPNINMPRVSVLHRTYMCDILAL